ncbi:ComC/BlpC family leader-containing pheromone/bacteriocin [Streptococcus anginosus]|nr:ComC/BlpC family leader-containing pheromone/bacteriocin [Streptococcus anginosus]KAA9319955.1 ComC/BlpC family leader-containing pheromone/bacteriocin [Streptococcus anginosus]
MDKEQTLNIFHSLTDQELEQIVGSGWLEKLLSPYLNKYKLGQSSQTNLG